MTDKKTSDGAKRKGKKMNERNDREREGKKNKNKNDCVKLVMQK